MQPSPQPRPSDNSRRWVVAVLFNGDVQGTDNMASFVCDSCGHEWVASNVVPCELCALRARVAELEALLQQHQTYQTRQGDKAAIAAVEVARRKELLEGKVVKLKTERMVK